MEDIRRRYDRGETVPDNLQKRVLKELLSSPHPNVLEDVVFLIERTVCPVDDPSLLVVTVQQDTFPGQLEVVRALVYAGSPVEAARTAANMRFENLWELICGTC